MYIAALYAIELPPGKDVNDIIIEKHKNSIIKYVLHWKE